MDAANVPQADVNLRGILHDSGRDNDGRDKSAPYRHEAAHVLMRLAAALVPQGSGRDSACVARLRQRRRLHHAEFVALGIEHDDMTAGEDAAHSRTELF